MTKANDLKNYLIPYLDEIADKKGRKYICPLCGSGTGNNGRGTPAFNIIPNTDETQWKCHACGESGDVIDLDRMLHGGEFKDAVKRLQEKYAVGSYVPKKRETRTEAPEQADYTDFFLKANSRLSECDYLTKRGICKQLQNAFHIGYVPDWKHPSVPNAPASPRIIIPTSKYSYLARDTRQDLTDKQKEYSKQKVGKMHILNAAGLYRKAEYCFVVEGEIDCLSVLQCGFNCIGLGSANVIESKLLPMCRKRKPDLVLIFALDNDEAGRLWEQKITEFQKIGIRCTSAAICGDCKDPNELLMKNSMQLTENLQKAVEDALQGGAVHALPEQVEVQPNGFQKPSDYSDAGNAEAFAAMYKGRMLYCDALGWLVWDGKRWDANAHAATANALHFTETMLQDALHEYKQQASADSVSGKITIPEAVMQYAKHARHSRGGGAIKSMLDLSRAYLNIKAAELDPNPFYLNTAAGIADLQTGKILPHDSAALCTRYAPYCPSKVGAEIWQDFLALITQDDAELQGYLQQLAGMCAVGEIFHEGIVLAIGGGRNGKSTFFNTLSLVLGDYAGGIDSTVLTTERQNRGAALATLRGRRLVTCGELEEGQRLSVQTLKRLASTDPLTIEEKFKQPETIKPTHHICLFSNFLPRVGSTDGGTWRRLTVIPFDATMPKGNGEILNYAEKLAKEAGGAILQWIIDGATAFCQNRFHLTIPYVIAAATQDYKQREDWLQLFLSECCTIIPGTSIRKGELYSAYKAYAASTGDYCRRQTDFNAAMEAAGFHEFEKGGRKKYWYDIALNETESENRYHYEIA